MNRELHITRSFKIDFKKLDKYEKLETREVVLKLQKDEPLEERFKDHSLHGNYEEKLFLRRREFSLDVKKSAD